MRFSDLGKESDLMPFQWRWRNGLKNELQMNRWRWLMRGVFKRLGHNKGERDEKFLGEEQPREDAFLEDF